MRLNDFAFSVPLNDNKNAAPDDLIKSHMRLVYAKAQKYKNSHLYADVVSAGMEILVRYAHKFSAEHGASFAQYVAQQIDYAIMNEVSRSKYGFNPSNLSKDLRKAYYAYPRYFNEDTPTSESRTKMATDLDIPLTVVDDVVTIIQHTYGPIGEDEDFVSDAYTPDEHYEQVQYDDTISAMITVALSTLNDRERTIIEKRKLSEEPVELRVLGELLGVTHQRVAQIETTALKKMQSAIIKNFKKENYVALFE